MDGTPGTVYIADGKSASFSTKEQVVSLQTRLINEDSREELFVAHRSRLANGEDVSLLYTSNMMDTDVVTKEVKEGVLGALEVLASTTAGEKELTRILVEALDKDKEKSYNLDTLINEFKKGCGL
jgi:arginine deiminase